MYPLWQILCGDQSSILSCNISSNSWVSHLVATLLYTAPDIKLHRLHAAACQAVAATGDRLSALDTLLLAAMEGDAKQVRHVSMCH